MPSSYDIIHSEKNEIVIADLDVDELITERDIVNDVSLSGLGSIKITIYDSEGEFIPHFHIIKNTKEKISCICLYEPRYFVHNGYTDTLNSKQRKQLDYILRLEHNDNGISNWKVMSNYWLNNVDKSGIYKSRGYDKYKQPDYNKLNGFIHK